MTLLVPDVAEGDMLEMRANKRATEDLILKLYSNNVTPGETDTELTYTEAAFTGYSAVNLLAADGTVVVGSPSELSYPQKSFDSTDDANSETIYGYFVVGATSGRISHAERFAASQLISNNGDSIKITVKLTQE